MKTQWDQMTYYRLYWCAESYHLLQHRPNQIITISKIHITAEDSRRNGYNHVFQTRISTELNSNAHQKHYFSLNRH